MSSVVQRLACDTSRAFPRNTPNRRIATCVGITTMKDVSLYRASHTSWTRELRCTNHRQIIQRHTNECTRCDLEIERLFLQDKFVKSMFVLQDIDTTMSNTSAKCEWPNLRAFRRFFATDGRVQRPTTANKTSNVSKKSSSEARNPEYFRMGRPVRMPTRPAAHC